MIDMNKKYTSDGRPVRLLCIDANGTHPVVALHDTGIPMSFLADGSCLNSKLNLIEVSTYADFKIDDPVMVRDYEGRSWEKSHFAGVTDGGKAKTWSGGCTSFTDDNQNDTCFWLQCRRPTAEELAS